MTCSARSGSLPCKPVMFGPTCIYCHRVLDARDRALGIDTSKRAPPIDGVGRIRAMLSHAMTLPEVDDLIDSELPPLLDLLERVRAIVDGAKDGPALAWLDAFAGIRDVLYPDTDVARQLNERRSMTPAEHAAARDRADARERQAWAGLTEADLPLVPNVPTCETCGMTLARIAEPGSIDQRWFCVRCNAEDG